MAAHGELGAEVGAVEDGWARGVHVSDDHDRARRDVDPRAMAAWPRLRRAGGGGGRARQRCRRRPERGFFTGEDFIVC